MPWLLTGHGSSCLEENLQQAHRRMKLCLFIFSTPVRAFVVISFGQSPRSKIQNTSSSTLSQRNHAQACGTYAGSGSAAVVEREMLEITEGCNEG